MNNHNDSPDVTLKKDLLKYTVAFILTYIIVQKKFDNHSFVHLFLYLFGTVIFDLFFLKKLSHCDVITQYGIRFFIIATVYWIYQNFTSNREDENENKNIIIIYAIIFCITYFVKYIQHIFNFKDIEGVIVFHKALFMLLTVKNTQITEKYIQYVIVYIINLYITTMSINKFTSYL